jgi:8-oxo-dGTP pyrophosphatase MutT (NUDIX family)
MTAALRETKEEAGLSKVKREHLTLLQSVLGIRIHRIRMFFGASRIRIRKSEVADPDPFLSYNWFPKKFRYLFTFCKACS